MEFSSDFIKKLKQRDQEAFERLYMVTRGILFNYILFRVNANYAVAEDVLSEVFCDAIDYAGSLSSGHNVKAWLFRIAKSKIADYFRQLVKDKNVVITHAASDSRAAKLIEDSVEDEYLIKEYRLLIRAAFSLMPEIYQEIMNKKYCDEKSVAEIAKLCHRSEKSVESYLFRGRKMLLKALKKLAGETILSPTNKKQVEGRKS
jgi:RNA polymerase sigma factor (sigma-70 family)